MKMAGLSVFLTLLVVLPSTSGWHDFTNPDFHCWSDSASASNEDTLDCDGISVVWLVEPPDEVKVDEAFSVTYQMTVDDDEFWDWAVDGASYNVFEDISSTTITTPDEAKDWCYNTTCPDALDDVEEDNCCVWHVNVHSCPISNSLTYCGPWIQPSGSVYTHSSVLWGQLQQGNWTSEVNGLHEEGTTQLIAHFKIASFQVALRKDIKVNPKTVCGDNKCEKKEGEDCARCPADCGRCPLEGWAIGLIAAVAALIVLSIAGVVLFFVIKQRRLLWDESWIIKYENLSQVGNTIKNSMLLSTIISRNSLVKSRAGNRRALMGSAVSIACSSMGSAAGQKGGMTNMTAQAFAKQIFCKTALYEGKTLAIKDIPKKTCPLTKQMRLEVREVRSLEHQNLVRFVGACLEVPHVCIATEYCPKGSLTDVLQNEDIPLNWGFRFSMATDVARGMAHLHSKKIYHGTLKSNNCIIDDRWTVKITDFALPALRTPVFGEGEEELEDDYNFKQRRSKVYTAPEFLNEKSFEPTAAGDVYAYAIILVEIGTREDPYGDEGGPDAVEDNWKPPVPDFSDETFDDKCPSKFDYLQLIRNCWMDNPVARPTFSEVKKALHKMNPSKLSPVDIMMAMMEKYSKHLETIVAERTQEMIAEKEKADKLLYSMIPKAVADELKKGKPIQAEEYSSCTIYFSDIVGFTNLSGGSTAVQVIALLNKLYVCFDSIIDNYDVYKVETIGDAYMVVSGIPKPNGIRHAREVCNMSIDLLSACKTFVIPHKPGEELKIRIGCHSGPACAGVVGLKMPRYCLFGDTVNTASRMESNGEAYKIHISSFTYDLLQQLGGFIFEKRGTIPVKGKGEMTTYWIMGRDAVGKKMADEIQERKISKTSSDSGYTEVTKTTREDKKGEIRESSTSPKSKSSNTANGRPLPVSRDRSKSITSTREKSAKRRSATSTEPPQLKQVWGDSNSGLTSID